MQHNKPEVKSDSSISCTFYDDDFTAFERHTTRFGSKLLKKIGYQEKGSDINGQGIVNPIKVEELTRYVGLIYVRKEVVECSKKTSEKTIMDDERSSSHSSDSEYSMGTCHRHTRRNHSKMIKNFWRRKNHCSY